MGKSKKKKKKSNSKAQYDAKKTEISKIEKSSENITKPSENAPEELLESVSPVEKTDTYEKAELKPEQEKEPELEVPAEPMIDIPYDPNFSEEDFYASVKELKAEDIKMPEENVTEIKEKKKISKVANITQLALLFICGAVALVCIFMLGKNIWGKIKGQELYSNTQFDGFTLDSNTSSDTRTLAKVGSDAPLLTLFDRINAKDSSVSEDTSGKYDEQLANMRASLSALKEQNDDIYGWIYIEGTNINHPVVRCDDNNYYLDHAYTGEYLPIGAIFADLTTKDLITDNYNTVIYGHNVVSTGQSSMFHDVEKFLDVEFFNKTKIYIYTMDGAFVYQPVAIYDTVSDYFYFRTVFSGETDFLAFAKEMVANSKHYTGAEFKSGDTMLTLSTCTNGAQNGRYSLHAKLVEIIK